MNGKNYALNLRKLLKALKNTLLKVLQTIFFFYNQIAVAALIESLRSKASSDLNSSTVSHRKGNTDHPRHSGPPGVPIIKYLTCQLIKLIKIEKTPCKYVY